MTDMPVPPPSPGAGGIGRETAEFGSRLVAVIIDWLIGAAMIIPVIIIGTILASISDVLGVLFFIVGYIGVIAAIVYVFWWGLGTTGQTPGKRSQGIAVLNSSTGQVLGGGQGIARELLKAIINSFCYIGSLWSLFDSENQALYDKVLTANTYKAEKGSIMPIFPDGKPF